MDPKSAQFLRGHHDFVLKLKIKSDDGCSQIRRIRLPRLADSSGSVSYDELVGLCVTFTFPEGSPENFAVSLTYFDVDEDTVTIASTEELMDAVEQFAEKKILRLTTEVKPKSTSASSSATSASPKPVSATSTERGTSTRDEAPLVNPQIRIVLDSFVGVLSTAVSHLQEGLAAPERSSSTQACGAGVSVSQEEPATVRAVDADNSGDTESARDQENGANKEGVEEPDIEEEAVPFIHGRHTCDSCLVTPIVGKRFHATSLPDYDLCENCYSNYKGKEVKFETAELDRDRVFQSRWQRRREKIQRFEAKRSEMGNRANRCFGKGPPGRFARAGAEPIGRRCVARPTAGAPRCPPPGSPQAHPPHMPPHCHHSQCPPPCQAHGPPPTVAPSRAPAHGTQIGPHCHQGSSSRPQNSDSLGNSTSSDRTSEFDEALKEAIRRSLRDVSPKEAGLLGKEKSSPDESTAAEPGGHKVGEVPPAHTTKEEVGGHREDVKSPAPFAKDVGSEEPEVTVEPNGTTEADHANDGGWNADETRAMEEAMETASVDSEKLLAEEDQKPPAELVEREISNNTDTSKDESFQSEAVGSGDVAEAVGATLDLVAGMISDMLSEEGWPAAPKHDGVEKHTNKHAAEHHNSDSSPGVLIVEQTAIAKDDDGKSNDVSEDNEWQVVATDGEEESLNGDGEIARAAEMLGSALFNSDMKSSAEHESQGNVSNLSDSFSVPSTVPSVSVSADQRQRWSAQLSKLQELGFDNEKHCVQILERLQAANVGVDCSDDVSVTKAVNTILEGN